MSIHRLVLRLLPLCLLWLAGCAVNPVTGERELMLVSQSEEVAMGAAHYAPVQQASGGLYSVDPELSAYVSEVGQRIAAVSDRPLDYEFVVVNSGDINAWALPGGKIGVNRGLLYELNNEAELAALLGHEVVHVAARHSAQRMSRSTLLGGALEIGSLLLKGNENKDLIMGTANVGANLLNLSYGRSDEKEADLYGIRYMVRAGYNPQAAVALQEVFVRLSEGDDPNWLEGLLRSHPPSIQRVKDNQALVDELMPTLQGQNLITGELRYQEATATLKRTKPAYDHFERAEQAYYDDRPEDALADVEAALAIVPEEARFHGLKGHLLLSEGKHRQALGSYNEALRLDDNYYEYYLGRGFAQSNLNRNAAAMRDLSRSNDLLPTYSAFNELGRLSLVTGDRTAAKKYFKEAAEAADADDSQREQAYESFVRLDITDNPAAYVTVEMLVGEYELIYGKVTNISPLPLERITLHFAAAVDGEVERRTVVMTDLLSNEYDYVETGLAFPAGSVWTEDMMAGEVGEVEIAGR